MKKNIFDKYYTKNEIVEFCMKYFIEYVVVNEEDLFIEPSAGNGAFINAIKKVSKNYQFYDIEPENEEIIKQDYLKLKFDFSKFKNIHVIGNPPFGKQSSLAIKFIKKSCEFCNSVSFILPKSFKKDSNKNKIPLLFNLIFEIDIPDNSFFFNNMEYNIPCVFQIWQKCNFMRLITKKIKPLNFSFVKKNQNPDISFRRVGVYAGKIDTNIENKNIQSHYFIKFNFILNNETFIKLNNINFEFNNTVGPKSISKQELIKEFNKIL